jgi:hypothetical protein
MISALRKLSGGDDRFERAATGTEAVLISEQRASDIQSLTACSALSLGRASHLLSGLSRGLQKFEVKEQTEYGYR